MKDRIFSVTAHGVVRREEDSSVRDVFRFTGDVMPCSTRHVIEYSGETYGGSPIALLIICALGIPIQYTCGQ